MCANEPCVCRLTKIMGSVTWIYKKSATIRVTVSLLYFGYNVIKNLLEDLVPFLKQKGPFKTIRRKLFSADNGLKCSYGGTEETCFFFFIATDVIPFWEEKKIKNSLDRYWPHFLNVLFICWDIQMWNTWGNTVCSRSGFKNVNLPGVALGHLFI